MDIPFWNEMNFNFTEMKFSVSAYRKLQCNEILAYTWVLLIKL